MERTLLLDQGFQPIGLIGWQRAITLLTLGKIEIIEEYDREVRSMYLVIKLPAVARLINRFRRGKKAVKFSRHNILARDRFKCQYCGHKVTTTSMTVDHVVPRAQGGITRWENVVTCCQDCNAKKKDRTPAQAKMHLYMEPVKPTWVPIFTIPISGPVPEQWTSYIYWTSELQT